MSFHPREKCQASMSSIQFNSTEKRIFAINPTDLTIVYCSDGNFLIIKSNRPLISTTNTITTSTSVATTMEIRSPDGIFLILHIEMDPWGASVFSCSVGLNVGYIWNVCWFDCEYGIPYEDLHHDAHEQKKREETTQRLFSTSYAWNDQEREKNGMRISRYANIHIYTSWTYIEPMYGFSPALLT